MPSAALGPQTQSADERSSRFSAGLRCEPARKFGLNAGIDIAHSPGTTAIYFVVGSGLGRRRTQPRIRMQTDS